MDGEHIIISAGWNGHASMNDIDIFKYDKSLNTVKRMDVIQDEFLKSLKNIEMKRNRPTSIAI